MVASTPSRVAGATVAIVGSLSRHIRHLGTGTLLAVADAKFVVTAAHVLRVAKEQGLTVAISPALGGVFTAVTARTWLLTSDEADDRHDVALYRLDEREVGRLGAADFVRIADVCFEKDLAAACFVICGFPGMWSTASNPDGDMTGRLLQYATYPFKGRTSGLGGFDAEKHILLEGTPGDLLDHNGEPTRFQTRSDIRRACLETFRESAAAASGESGISELRFLNGISMPRKSWAYKRASLGLPAPSRQLAGTQ
jgi:hypothetical protein